MNRTSQCCDAPPLGEIEDGFGMCSACKDHAEFLPECPKCESTNTTKEHHPGSFAAPETWYMRCAECGHEWDHQ